jgi:heme/copper-type cytochrome/quinol oxidase subunit 1
MNLLSYIGNINTIYTAINLGTKPNRKSHMPCSYMWYDNYTTTLILPITCSDFMQIFLLYLETLLGIIF